MILDLLHRHLPSSYRVALLAASAKLAFVDVGMAISTFPSHITKDRLDVTRGASHLLVQTTQRESRLVMVKLGNATDGFPSAKRMTILACDIQRSVWAASVGIRLRLIADYKERQQRRRHCHD